MNIKSNMSLAVAAIVVYLLGGVFVFSGTGLVLFGGDIDVFGWGNGATIGYLWLALGFCFSVIGVLIMRLCRNRGLL